jgi:hypothetical protein
MNLMSLLLAGIMLLPLFSLGRHAYLAVFDQDEFLRKAEAHPQSKALLDRLGHKKAIRLQVGGWFFMLALFILNLVFGLLGWGS